MRSRYGDDNKRIRQRNLLVLGVLALCAFVFLISLGRQYEVRPSIDLRSSPPTVFSPFDLRQCTRIEIRYHYGIPPLELLASWGPRVDLLSTDEKTYLESLGKVVTIHDKKAIDEVADALGSGSNDGGTGEHVRMRDELDVLCYSNDRCIADIPMYGPDFVVTRDGRMFTFSHPLPDLAILAPQTRPFVLRLYCALNLGELREKIEESRRSISPRGWCDDIVRTDRASGVSDEQTLRSFQCPDAGKGRCHYAVNPECKPDSPADAVLLFETKSGWNQHGGSKLFTFDNHNPKGGMVLLHEGTIRFIRTEEELKQLRWQ